jgi:protein-disulfide isomerase
MIVTGGVAKSRARVSSDAAFDDKVAAYVREKYGIPPNVKLTVDPFQSSNFRGFLTSTLTTDNGKDSNKTKVFLTDDRHYLIVGELYTIGSDPTREIVQHLREQFKLPQTTTLTVGPFRKSAFPNLLVTTVAAETAKGKQNQDFYVTTDTHTLVAGNVLNLGVDLRRTALKTIVTTNQPSQGPARAPVTIVEYADLECPMCGRLHEFLETELLPKYPDKVRIIFKEFPLTAIHDWSLTAAIANECVYQIKPEAFASYRTLIFQNQATTNTTNVRDLLLGYADQVGVDRVTLAGCLDAKASLPLVEAGLREGKLLEILRTPTCFMNGRTMAGFPSADAYYQAVDEALKEAK